MKAKLYTDKEEYEAQMFIIANGFGLCFKGRRGCALWCEKEQVRGDHSEHAGKWILTLPTDGHFKADHLVDGAIDFDEDWLPPR